MNRFHHLLDELSGWAWILLLVGLPLTSYPPLARLLESAVAPFSLLPALFLVLFWLVPHLVKRGSLPLESKPVLVFVLVAVVASAGALFIDIPGGKNISILVQMPRAFLSLGIGVVFFFLCAAWPASVERLVESLRWVHTGGAVLVAWALLQGLFIFFDVDQFPGWMRAIQELIVIPSPNFTPLTGRVTGFTYEPSWLAHQLVLCYLPLWIAATLERKSVFDFRFLHLSIENLLLVAGLLVFYLCSPRISLVSFGLLLVAVFFKLSAKAYHRILARLAGDQTSSGKGSPFPRLGLRLLSLVLIAGVSIFVLAGLAYLGSQRDWRLARVTDRLPTRGEIGAALVLDENTLLDLSARYVFLERAVFWITGWRILDIYPWLGVGLGNAGYFDVSLMPALGWASDEIRAMLSNADVVPNVKSLWVRILAETGLVGFSVFLAWLYLLWQSTRGSAGSHQPEQRVIALAGELALIALVGEGFSLDYFAMPYLWVMAGWIAANGYVNRMRQ